MVISNICTNGLMNCNDIIGQTIMNITLVSTGDLFLTFLSIIVLFLALALMFNIRLEYTSIIILPLLLGLMIISGRFISFGAIILIYLAIILTGNFMLK
jgi:hypothetical protein